MPTPATDVDGWLRESTVRQASRQADRRADRRTGGQTDKRSESSCPPLALLLPSSYPPPLDLLLTSSSPPPSFLPLLDLLLPSPHHPLTPPPPLLLPSLQALLDIEQEQSQRGETMRQKQQAENLQLRQVSAPLRRMLRLILILTYSDAYSD